jgi:hypothetical protein
VEVENLPAIIRPAASVDNWNKLDKGENIKQTVASKTLIKLVTINSPRKVILFNAASYRISVT